MGGWLWILCKAERDPCRRNLILAKIDYWGTWNQETAADCKGKHASRIRNRSHLGHIFGFFEVLIAIVFDWPLDSEFRFESSKMKVQPRNNLLSVVLNICITFTNSRWGRLSKTVETYGKNNSKLFKLELSLIAYSAPYWQ